MSRVSCFVIVTMIIAIPFWNNESSLKTLLYSRTGHKNTFELYQFSLEKRNNEIFTDNSLGVSIASFRSS